MRKVMLHHVNKLCCILLLIVIVTSCRWELSSDELRQKRKDSYQVSVSAVGYDNYWTIYNAMNDSVKVWAKNELGLYKYFNNDSIKYGITYQIDSLLCFNIQKNMCFTAILRRHIDEEEVMDSIWHFFGIKINNQWYFFDGASLGLPREYYQEDIHVPLSFEKLKELAMKHLYQGYIHRSKDGSWEINDAFFNEYYKYDAFSNPIRTDAERDSSWLKACRKNWSKGNKK